MAKSGLEPCFGESQGVVLSRPHKTFRDPLRVFSETQVTVDTHLRAYVKTHRLHNRQL